uniref:Uncharacterized protein n=1 Tax=Bionectria ochroleuca TaxID=29856 RepID=A0A8H7KCS8_BIOOC
MDAFTEACAKSCPINDSARLAPTSTASSTASSIPSTTLLKPPHSQYRPTHIQRASELGRRLAASQRSSYQLACLLACLPPYLYILRRRPPPPASTFSTSPVPAKLRSM